MRVKLTWAIALASAAVLATGCGSSKKSNGTATAAAAKSDGVAGKTVVLVSPSDINPWMKQFTTHILDGLAAKGVKTKHLQDPFDPNRNVQNLNLALAQKPDLVLEVPIDDNAITPSLHRAQAAKVPVINLNGPPSPANLPLLAGSFEADHKALGTFAALNIVEGLQKAGVSKGNVIAITGNAASSQVPARMAAFKAELAKHPGYKLVAVEDGNWDLATSAKLAQQLFAKYRSTGGIQAGYGMADNEALGIVQAAKQAGLPIGVSKKGLIVTGSNCFKVGIDAIKAGQMYGTATQAPGPQGDASAELALKYLAGEKLPQRSFVAEQRVTPDTVSQAEGPCTY
jgi:ABC-type sugar transport system substrate-binding protein